MPIDITVSGDEPPFAAKLYGTVYGVCKEALHNTLAHSMADRQSIIAEASPERLTLRISDNGQFHGTFEKGFGLNAMEKRVRDSGGTIVFSAEEGKGFVITAQWGESV